MAPSIALDAITSTARPSHPNPTSDPVEDRRVVIEALAKARWTNAIKWEDLHPQFVAGQLDGAEQKLSAFEALPATAREALSRLLGGGK